MLDLQCLWDQVTKCLYCRESWYVIGIYLWSAVIFFPLKQVKLLFIVRSSLDL